MFPKPIERSSVAVRTGYQLILPVALFLWLLPLLAIFLTSIRPAADINVGNIFGMPSDFLLVENYLAVFRNQRLERTCGIQCASRYPQ